MKPLTSVVQERGEEVIKTSTGFIRYRYVICLLVFMGLALVYAMRVNLSIAIINMAGSVEMNHTNTGVCVDVDREPHNDNSTSKPDFDWTPNMRNALLGAFFNGYITTQVIGGILAAKFSVKRIFGYGVFLTSLLTLATDGAAHWHYNAIFALRFLEGVTEGVTVAAMYGLIARWAPEHERTTMTVLCSIGTSFGTVITMPIAAVLCSSSLGWPASFYIPGALGVLWALLWQIFATLQPEDHRLISVEEREYIIANRGTFFYSQGHIPWTSMLTSRAIWILSFSRLICSLTFYMFLTEMPTFLDSVFGISLNKIGALNCCFHILYACTFLSSGFLSDQMIRMNILSKTNVRKLFQCSSFVLSGSMLLIVTQLGCDRVAVFVILCLAAAFLALTGGGEAAMPLDLSPRLVCLVIGIGNTVGCFGAIMVTRLVSYTTNIHDVKAGWNLAFTIVAAANFVGAIMFFIFGTAEEQPWARGEHYELNSVGEVARQETLECLSLNNFAILSEQ